MSGSRLVRRLAPVVLIVLLSVTGCRMFRSFEHSQVYHPSAQLQAEAADLRRPFQELTLDVNDGIKIHAWFFPAGTNAAHPNKAFLICHGNGGNISHRLDLCEALLECGAAVLVFDYRGYGRSSGRPDEEGTYQDAQTAYRWLRQKQFDGKDIFLFGESLGGAVATELALREPAGGLILQSTFTSIPDIGAELLPWLPVRWISTIKYDTRGKLPKLSLPILILHSRGDSLIKFHHAEKNFAAANHPKQFCEIDGDHNDGLFTGRQRFMDPIRDLISKP